MITNDVPNGTILVASTTQEAILFVKLSYQATWAYNLKYDGTCWAYPNDEISVNFASVENISNKYIMKAKRLLKSLFNVKQMSNLDYIEALAKIKEYEKEKV